MWFDSSSRIANLAKNALKEAQKHIDNVLDISNEDENVEVIDDHKMPQSKTISSLEDVVRNELQDSSWGPFNGSFFEQKMSSTVPITNPPPKKVETSSDSLEILSPSSDVSSSQSTKGSVEVIHEKASVVESSRIVETSEDEDDVLMTPDEVPSMPLSQEIEISTTLTNSDASSFYDTTKEDEEQTLKPINMDKSMESFEVHTQTSDSTHSFEEIQIQNPSKAKVDALEEIKIDERKDGSGDEIETATSSDIEIISSPNCDSSSTNSFNKTRLKPEFPYQNSESCLSELKLDRMKQHNRELSEVSILSDDSPGSPSEHEKLIKRISELSETLEQREYKMMQLGRNNAELEDANSKLSLQLDEIKANRNTLDITNVQEEYTQRLSALEKKFQQAIRENAMLKRQTDVMKIDMDAKVSRAECDKVISEKEYLIDALKLEGDSLSKQILNHSTVIKKLRVKLKDSEEKQKKQNSQIAELSDENQKFKKALTIKEEIEKSQNEGINKLTTEKRKIDKENLQLKRQNEDWQQKLLALQTSHELLKNELDKKNAEMFQSLEDDKEKALNESNEVKKELSDLRIKICEMEVSATTQAQKLRQENIILKQKLEETEFRIEDQKQEASLASIPLIRQLESLQYTFNIRTKQWENQEKQLLEKLDSAENQLKSQSDVDKAVKDQVIHLNLKVYNLEEKLLQTSRKLEKITGQLQQRDIEFQLHENDYKLAIEQLTMELTERINHIEKLKHSVLELEGKLTLKGEEIEDEKRKFLVQQQQRQDSRDHELGNISPVPSVESLHSHPWNVDDMDTSANYSSSQYGGIIDGLQSIDALSILKQRDGEVQQLQWEIHRMQTERNFLSNEISSLNIDLEKASEEIKNTSQLQEKQAEMQMKYDALLEMFGQKMEEYEELKLDLVDLRSITQIQKAQINELTQKLKDTIS